MLLQPLVSLLVFVVSLVYPILSQTHIHGGDTFDLENERVLLLTAHPDDECMFFAPTVLALTQNYQQRLQTKLTTDTQVEGHVEDDSPLFSLCMSIGNADGLGSTRRVELEKSLEVLGIKHSWAVDHPELQDNFAATWDALVIANVLKPYLVDNRITIVLTFDNGGISGHRNHISLPIGVKHLLKTTSSLSHVRLYSLVTVSLLPKYLGPMSAIIAALRVGRLSYIVRHLLLFQARLIFRLWGFSYTIEPPPNLPGDPIVFVSNVPSYLQALKAMRQHWSQLVWFRWLYVSFSRYMWVNEWVQVVQ